jgi:transposase-like protein
MARRGHPPEFRRRVVDLVEGGRKVSEVAADLPETPRILLALRKSLISTHEKA